MENDTSLRHELVEAYLTASCNDTAPPPWTQTTIKRGLYAETHKLPALALKGSFVKPHFHMSDEE